MKSFFDKLQDDRLFSVLASQNRYLYLECLFLLYDELDEMESKGENNKKDIIKIIEGFLDERTDFTFYEEDDQIQGNYLRATYIVNKFITTGWLLVEPVSNNQVNISFYDYANRLLRTLLDIREETITHYSAKISGIYNDLKYIDPNDSFSVIENIYEDTRNIITNLKSLRSNIYVYYNNLVKNKDDEQLKQIVERLLDYKTNFFDRAYYNLKTKDTLAIYKKGILESIDNLINKKGNIERIALQNSNNNLSETEKQENLVEKLQKIKTTFLEIGKIIHSIDKKNNSYINATLSKIRFFINRDDDIEGVINRLLDVFIKDEDTTFQTFNIIDTKILDSGSIYTEKALSKKVKGDRLKLNVEVFDESLKQAKIGEIMKSKRFSISSVNKFVDLGMGNRNQLKASELQLDEYDDYLMVILVFLYARSNTANYNITMLESRISVNKISFQDFWIRRKK